MPSVIPAFADYHFFAAPTLLPLFIYVHSFITITNEPLLLCFRRHFYPYISYGPSSSYPFNHTWEYGMKRAVVVGMLSWLSVIKKKWKIISQKKYVHINVLSHFTYVFPFEKKSYHYNHLWIMCVCVYVSCCVQTVRHEFKYECHIECSRCYIYFENMNHL